MLLVGLERNETIGQIIVYLREKGFKPVIVTKKINHKLYLKFRHITNKNPNIVFCVKRGTNNDEIFEFCHSSNTQNYLLLNKKVSLNFSKTGNIKTDTLDNNIKKILIFFFVAYQSEDQHSI